MDLLFRRLLPGLDKHLSDARIASFFCDELSFAARLIAKRHLARCWRCRVRQEDLEGRRADRMVDLYREALEGSELSLSAAPRAEFLQRLDLQVQRHATPGKGWVFRLHQSLSRPLQVHKPLIACMVIALLGVLSFFGWQQRLPNIDSNTLLSRAETWNKPDPTTSGGVVLQVLQITTSEQTMSHSIYRDLQGRRHLKYVQLAEKEKKLKRTLTQAGLDWDEPLSAFNYREWHDRQPVREDKILRTGKHLLTLTTKVGGSDVSKQSLTVRDTDFHPVRRTVVLRDSRTVEIAEVDFKILPWSAVDTNVFESIEKVGNTALPISSGSLAPPRMPEMLTEGQLEETELGARLILNQLHADTGEQIEINRIPQGVEVKGLVETEERKQTLQMQLRTVPHVSVSIQSVVALKNSPASSDAATSLKMASMPDQPSPLEIYLMARGRNVNSINTLAQQLFNNALTISQESKAIRDLQTHFIQGTQKTLVASATLSELIYSHHDRLQIALKHERELLAETQGIPENQASISISKEASLMEAATRNLTLCKELTQTNSSATRSAEKILAEMSLSIEHLTVRAHEMYGKSQENSSLSEKK